LEEGKMEGFHSVDEKPPFEKELQKDIQKHSKKKGQK